ncbi:MULTISPECIES: aldehyde dehydrogenase family protein [unclassified Mycolicibacterium]|uniref:aldehyde dehydrogenase family protein n=1 Tax=unclassified Mycolicibacterium TaxID=2636767 RepID=UPI0012DF25CE|nr:MULTISPECIES: aldehyde dehydrogenase family protein [unclassified Mycolicibacterium]MUL82235.1 aldehyde dehydrogenase family protein [Mycolicibacterium sp. CBMA 329]MUL88001.1 aldehyde dehydrogenase family protein [Mycolicibacterium sp. CBMA 331]MUM02331.1 aldehyde dehydrogenase family protein [Mycolicibacterium sp. CBMA 334]MUM26356.1 aldehyde dehydrogenase family protein [Mycolicibacterium sp. CBMA 295]MUM38298.1 aldehyde dehydrogenase family protein [Mycolicibacterium sp. CBMA 247]
MNSVVIAAGRTDRLLIGGQWCAPLIATEPADVHDPSTGRVIGQVPVGGAADVDRAVAAAKDAGRQWSMTAPEFRAALLDEVAQRIADRIDEFASAITAEMGAPLDNARDVQTQLAIDVFRSYAGIAREFVWEQPLRAGIVRHEPIGVVAAITPWNYPLYLASIKIAAALAAGCTVVFKPSLDAPLDAFLLTQTIVEVARDMGAPTGIVNLVSGRGTVVGEAISTHPGIAAVSFTGSTAAGRRVSAAASATIKRVGLELGGKSAAIVLDDGVDLETALSGALANVYYNSGQTCTACARILVPHCRYDDAVAIAEQITRRWTIGDPRLPGEHIGPIATRSQYESVIEYLNSGVAEGAQLVAGGLPDADQVPDHLRAGNWVLPTLFADVRPGMTIEREEIFGPVALLMAYADETDAVRMANDSIYGLSGAVWGADHERVLDVARGLETGRVVINGGPFDVLAPTGGYKQSGNGRELGVHGLLEFLEVKSLLMPLTGGQMGPRS